MNPIEYVASIKNRLLVDALILDYDVLAERASEWEGYIRMRVFLSDSSLLDFSEYLIPAENGGIEVITYGYQWMDEDKNLIRRWDNTPHFPKLKNFPHHIHDGATGQVTPGKALDIFAVLDEIAGRLGRE